MCKAVELYLEKRKSRQYVGRLSKEKNIFVFEYDETYRRGDNPIPIGPDLPISKAKHKSKKLFPSFLDRIPSRNNPAYEEYCQSVGISPSETNPFILLAKLGKKGPSSFVCEQVLEEQAFSAEDLKQFRKDIKLSIREFSDLFSISASTIYRIENKKTSGRDTLKQMEIYYKFPKIALERVKRAGSKLHERKKNFVEKFLNQKSKNKA